MSHNLFISCSRRDNEQGRIFNIKFAQQHSAVIYTLLGSCRQHGINPFDYLKDLFTRLPAANITQIKDFTPAAWAKDKNMEKVFAQAA